MYVAYRYQHVTVSLHYLPTGAEPDIFIWGGHWRARQILGGSAPPGTPLAPPLLAKMSAFNSPMQQNACYRNIIEPLQICCHVIVTQ